MVGEPEPKEISEYSMHRLNDIALQRYSLYQSEPTISDTFFRVLIVFKASEIAGSDLSMESRPKTNFILSGPFR